MVSEKRVSPLFSQLKSFLGNGKDALIWYRKAMGSDFAKRHPNFRRNEFGEPLFEDLLTKIGMYKLKGEKETLSMLNKEIGHKPVQKDYGHVAQLQEQAVRFNNNSPFRDSYYATVEDVIEDNNVKAAITVKPNRERTISDEPQRIAVNYSLNKKLEALLNSYGIGIGVLTKLEENTGVNGVTDFNVALDTANGIKEVIRLAHGDKGQAALPEEFAHFAVEALGDNFLKSRVLATLRDESVLRRIFGQSYDDYMNKYNDLGTMAEEALGKLVAKALVDEDVYTPSPNLFSRFLDLLKNFFSRFRVQDIDSIINQAQNEAYQLAKGIVTRRFDLNINNIRYNQKFYSLSNKVDRDTKLLERIIEQELKRLKIYGKKEDFSIAQQSYIEELSESINENKALEGIYTYIQTSLGVLEKLQERLRTVTNMDSPLNEKMAALRNIRNYMSSYGSIIEEIRKEMNKAASEGDNRFKEKLRVLLNENSSILADLGTDFYTVSKELFTDFVRPYVGEGLAITITRDKYKKTYTAEELVTSLDRDITFFDRWLDSMADSTDPMLQIYDQAVKEQKGLARQDAINTMKEIEFKTRELELSGVKNTAWMYEVDDKGKPTGDFIQPIWWHKYRAEKRKFNEYLKKKYGDNPEGFELEERAKEIANWYSNNTTKDSSGMVVPLESKYSNPQWSKLNKAQKDYHAYIMDLKTKLDRILPEKYTRTTKAPQIRRDFLQRMLNSGNKTKYFWESMKDNLVRREDDTDVEDKAVIMDFEGNPVNRLPIYYTRELEDMNDLSLDAASSMIAYASMVYDFNRMNEVLDTLEVGRLVLAERKVAQLEGDKTRIEGYKLLGRDVKNLLTKKGTNSLFMDKLNTFMDMQVYGRYLKDEGTIGDSKVDVNKATALLMKMTSYSTTALSLLTGTANVLQNFAMSNVEAASNRFFNYKELVYADKEYAKYLSSYLGEIGNRIKTNKIELFDELFNVQQDFKQRIKGIDWSNKTWATRLLGENAIFFTTQAGDHWTQNRIAIALASRLKLKKGSETISLWDALEVVPIDKNRPKLGAKLQIKPGVTKEDGTTFGSKDIVKFSNKVRGVENQLYGIYNSEDRNALKQLAVGRMVMMYRDWMRPLWLSRFGRGKYNFDLQDFTEGYYQTGYRFVKQMVKDIKQSEFDIISQWKNLTPLEKGNIKKALTEIGMYAGLSMLIGMLEAAGGDDENKPWALRMAAYSALRLKSDMGALLPSYTMLDESLKLLDDPAVIISTLKKLRNLIKLLDPESYDEVIQSGPYKGFTKAERYILDMLPFRKQVVNALDPDQPARWFKADAR